MILDLCGGEASHVVSAGAVPDTARSYALRKTRVASLAGADIPVARQKEILAALGYGVTETADALTCAVPSLAAGRPWRGRPRGRGLPHLGPRQYSAQPMARTSAIAKPVLNPLQKRMLAARRALAARGFNEAITWAFLPEEHAQAVRRRPAGAEARQPDLVGTLRHAPLAAGRTSSPRRAATWTAASPT